MPTSQRGRRASCARKPNFSADSSGSCSASCCCSTLLSAYENAATTAHVTATANWPTETSTASSFVTSPPGRSENGASCRRDPDPSPTSTLTEGCAGAVFASIGGGPEERPASS